MKIRHALLVLVLLGSGSPVMAGLYTDDLSRCLVDSTTPADRTVLVKWIFAAMAQHPAVASLATVKAADLEKSSTDVGALFMRLLTESCVEKTKAAVKYEGPAAIQLAFQVLGQVASSEIFASPEVGKYMADLSKHIDAKKLEALKESKPDTPK